MALKKLGQPTHSKIGIVVVSYGHEKQVARLLESILPQLKDGDKFVVVDNKKPYNYQRTNGSKNIDILIEHENGGFAAGCNIGVQAIIDNVDLLFLMNPDTMATDGLLDGLRDGDTESYAAWQPLILLDDGRVNSAGNVVHYSGLSWCGGYLSTSEMYQNTFEVDSLSGAALMIRAEWWKKIGGMDEQYFMYYEDLDLSTRILLSGGRLACLSNVKVIHEYEYDKGDYKWLYIGRNRLAYMLINWHTSILILLTPALVVFEIILTLIYIRQGRFLLKVKASISLMRNIKWIKERRILNAHARTITPVQLFMHIEHALNSPALGLIGTNKTVNLMLSIYYKAALGALRIVTRKG